MRDTHRLGEMRSQTCLGSGHIADGVVEAHYDPFKQTRVIAGSPHILTDGRRVWPATLIYFIRNYNLHLREEFTARAAASQW